MLATLFRYFQGNELAGPTPWFGSQDGLYGVDQIQPPRLVESIQPVEQVGIVVKLFEQMSMTTGMIAVPGYVLVNCLAISIDEIIEDSR